MRSIESQLINVGVWLVREDMGDQLRLSIKTIAEYHQRIGRKVQ